MNEFMVLPQSKLDETAFDHYPVWSEHYDYEEIEDIERWGLDVEEVLNKFSENSPGNEHCVYTLLESNPFPERMRIFIKASISTNSGVELVGYVVNENAYCLTVFYGGQEFIFSSHPLLEGENKLSEQGLAKELDCSVSEIFPLQYTTAYTSKRGEKIRGSFWCGTKT